MAMQLLLVNAKLHSENFDALDGDGINQINNNVCWIWISLINTSDGGLSFHSHQSHIFPILNPQWAETVSAGQESYVHVTRRQTLSGIVGWS